MRSANWARRSARIPRWAGSEASQAGICCGVITAQAGVRYSLDHPEAYVDANMQGFANVLEGCRHNGCRHLLYASSSSVYGANTRLPFSTHDNVDHPLSIYGASKKANELMAHSYAHLFSVPITGLRFFTVYGPWGRPDMAMWLFADAILKGEPITLFNHGKMKRDFTYVDDIVESITRLVPKVAEPNPDWDGAKPDPGTSRAPYRVYNIGNNSPVELMHLVATMEKSLGIEAKKIFAPIEIGDGGERGLCRGHRSHLRSVPLALGSPRALLGVLRHRRLGAVLDHRHRDHRQPLRGHRPHSAARRRVRAHGVHDLPRAGRA